MSEYSNTNPPWIRPGPSPYFAANTPYFQTGNAPFSRHGLHLVYYQHGCPYFYPQPYFQTPQVVYSSPPPVYFNPLCPPPYIANPLRHTFQARSAAEAAHVETNVLPAPVNGATAKSDELFSNVADHTDAAGNVSCEPRASSEVYTKRIPHDIHQQNQQSSKRQEQQSIEQDSQTLLKQSQPCEHQNGKWEADQYGNNNSGRKQFRTKNVYPTRYQQRNKPTNIDTPGEMNSAIAAIQHEQLSKTHFKDTNHQVSGAKQTEPDQLRDRSTEHANRAGSGRNRATNKSHNAHDKFHTTSGNRSQAENDRFDTMSEIRSQTENDIFHTMSCNRAQDTKDRFRTMSGNRPLIENDRFHHGPNAARSYLPRNSNNKHVSVTSARLQEPRASHFENPVPEFKDLKLNSEDVVLDVSNSDLNAKVEHSGYHVSTLSKPEGFRLLFAGCKANSGVKRGRVFFEAKITDAPDHNMSGKVAGSTMALVGWSEKSTSLDLGEEAMSFGYGSCGRFSANGINRNYGEVFTVNDVIGALIDLDSRPATVSFMKNGKDFGIAESWGDNCETGNQRVIMYPHIHLKNCTVAVNFGQQKAWFPPPKGYTYIGKIPSSDRVDGSMPWTGKQREVIMMVGLPGSGKTTWANKHQQENPEKRYCILGTDLLIDKMALTDLPRSPYSRKFQELYPLAEACFNKLLDIAVERRRNCILDQTNLVKKARGRKLERFSGFHKIAVVVQPTDKELERRAEERTARSGKTVPPEKLLEMKTSYSLPSQAIFDEVRYPELPEKQVCRLVQGYNSRELWQRLL